MLNSQPGACQPVQLPTGSQELPHTPHLFMSPHPERTKAQLQVPTVAPSGSVLLRQPQEVTHGQAAPTGDHQITFINPTFT